MASVSMADEIVIVTGGSGFLGQHIVRCLQERADWVKEIRVLDKTPYVNKLGHEESKPIKYFECDIIDESTFNDAFVGVTCVIHCAGVVSRGFFPDDKMMYDVNVTGTGNIIKSCVSHGVTKLVLTSTVDSILSKDKFIFNSTESQVTYPDVKKLFFPGYGGSKAEAEKMVMKADKTPLQSGATLRTCVLRCTALYGEGDEMLVTLPLKVTKQYRGTLVRVGHPDNRFQVSYAGNAAWAHVCALQALSNKPQEAGGEAFFITDNTEIDNFFDFLDPYLEAHGLKSTPFSIPGFIFRPVLLLMELWIHHIWKKDLSIPLTTIAEYDYINGIAVFNRIKSTLRLDYDPPYSHEESQTRSLKYYSKIDLN